MFQGKTLLNTFLWSFISFNARSKYFQFTFCPEIPGESASLFGKWLTQDAVVDFFRQGLDLCGELLSDVLQNSLVLGGRNERNRQSFGLKSSGSSDLLSLPYSIGVRQSCFEWGLLCANRCLLGSGPFEYFGGKREPAFEFILVIIGRIYAPSQVLQWLWWCNGSQRYRSMKIKYL